MRKWMLGLALLTAVAIATASVWGLTAARRERPLPSRDRVAIPVRKIPLMRVAAKPVAADRVFLVSDIHGRFGSLKKALSDVHFGKRDALFVLGDTIDRGPDGFHALLYLTKTLPARGYHVTVLQGNHEDMWLTVADRGATDGARLRHLEDAIGAYHDDIPYGWLASETEWERLTAGQRTFLLDEMADGFGQPRQLIVSADGLWLSLSHSANFAKPVSAQTVADLSTNNRNMIDAPATFRDSLAAQQGVPVADTQVFIGHISKILFGRQPEFTDLDDTPAQAPIKDFVDTPVRIYCLNDGRFHD